MDAMQAAADAGQGSAGSTLKIKLLARRADLIDRLTKNQKVYDVVNDRILTRSEGSSFAVGPAPKVVTGKAGTLKYIPQGSMEPPEDYAKRIALTPWFSETKDILNDREGSIFSDPPLVQYKAGTPDRAAPAVQPKSVDTPLVVANPSGEKPTGNAGVSSDVEEEVNPLQEFIESSTADGKPFDVFAAEALRALQIGGYAAAFVDQRAAPSGIDPARMSKADAKKTKTGEPVIVFYEADQILDYDFDPSGSLAWIKVVESSIERAAWNSDAEHVKTVFVIDAVNVKSWKIYDSKPEPVPQPDVAHGRGFVPVALGNFFADKSGLGNSCLIQCADADIAATQILSDLRWTLFVLGSPILQFRAQSTDEGKTARQLGVGTSRYTIVNCAKGEMGEEDLSFVQMDAAGIEWLYNLYSEMKNKAKDASGKGGDVALTAPAEQSGVSRAWEFKTGEERMLFLLTFQLQTFCTAIIKIVAQVKGLDPALFCVEFSKDFEVADPTKKATALGPVIETCKTYKLSSALQAGLRELIEISIDMTPEEKAEFENELAAIDLAADAQAEADMKAEQMKAMAGNPAPGSKPVTFP